MEIDKFVHLNRLYSIYKELLTDKQKEILELYLVEDFSLGEISEELGISRQAAHDAIKRSEQLLQDAENKLGIIDRENQISSKVNSIIELIHKPETEIDKKTKQEILDVCKELI